MSGSFHGLQIFGVTNLVAGGNSQATAPTLQAEINVFTTVLPGTGCRSPAIASRITVLNADVAGGNSLAWYPPVGDQFSGYAVNQPIMLPPGIPTTWGWFGSALDPAPRVWIPLALSPAAGILSLGGLVITGSGLIIESAIGGIVAGTTRNRGGATPLTREINQIDVSTVTGAGVAVGDGVVLMPAQIGLDVTVINNTNNLIQVYAAGSDTLNSIAGATGIAIAPFASELFECAVAGQWKVESGVGTAGALPTVLALDGITALGNSQGTAVALVMDLNRVVSAAAGTGVVLPVAKAGLDIMILNRGANAIQVYGNGSDTVDDIAGPTGVTQMIRSEVWFTCYADGAWYTNGLNAGYAGNGLGTISFTDGVTAAGTTQATATPLTTMISTVSTVASGTGVNLPSSANGAGLLITVINSGANALAVYPAQGAADTINGSASTVGVSLFPGTAAVFNCTASGVWTTQPSTTKQAGANTVAAATPTLNLTAAQITGGAASVDLSINGVVAGAISAVLPTVALMVAALHSPTVGTSFKLRIINSNTTQAVTVNAAAAGWTVAGAPNNTLTIATATWREFDVTITAIGTPAATLFSAAVGTFS